MEHHRIGGRETFWPCDTRAKIYKVSCIKSAINPSTKSKLLFVSVPLVTSITYFLGFIKTTTSKRLNDGNVCALRTCSNNKNVNIIINCNNNSINNNTNNERANNINNKSMIDNYKLDITKRLRWKEWVTMFI